MKLKLLVLVAFVMMTTSSFAQFFPARAHVTIFPGRVTAEVYNPYYEPIVCNGFVYGATAYGPVMNMYMPDQFIPAGHQRFVFVQTTPFNPFMNGWAHINCRFARMF